MRHQLRRRWRMEREVGRAPPNHGRSCWGQWLLHHRRLLSLLLIGFSEFCLSMRVVAHIPVSAFAGHPKFAHFPLIKCSRSFSGSLSDLGRPMGIITVGPAWTSPICQPLMAKQGLVAVMLSGYTPTATAAFSSYQGRCWDVLIIALIIQQVQMRRFVSRHYSTDGSEVGRIGMVRSIKFYRPARVGEISMRSVL